MNTEKEKHVGFRVLLCTTTTKMDQTGSCFTARPYVHPYIRISDAPIVPQMSQGSQRFFLDWNYITKDSAIGELLFSLHKH